MGKNMEHAEAPDFSDFNQLFLKNHQFLCIVAAKIVHDDFIAKDLVQDFFVKFWEARNHIKPKKFEAYAYRSIKNSCFNYLKHQAVQDKHHSHLQVEDFESRETEDELPDRERRLKRILELLNELPAERRKVFELHAIQDLSYKQIGEKLGISVNTVKTQLRRSYSTLRGKAIVIVVLYHLTKHL